MSDFHLIPMVQPLAVEGTATSSSIGDFSGRVIALAVRGLDPIATPDPNGDGPSETEGLLGWGTTHMLVADPSRPAPFWVSKDEIRQHRFAEATPAQATVRAGS